MKLYATTTSERASKGQGGNKYINFELTVGENQTVMLFGQLVCEETETENIYRLWNGDICVDTLRETKGEKKKGECTHERQYVFNTIRGQECKMCTK